MIRNKLLSYSLAVLAVSPALLCAVVPAQAKDKKPNILVIWSDDIGRDNISAYSLGIMGYKTPTFITSMLVVIFMGLFACSTTSKSQYQLDEQRASVREMASQTLAQLYQANPGSRNAIRNAAGYAVFSDFGLKILFLGGAKGEGIAMNNRTGQETFMKMVELQPGLGLGANKFRLVFVFDTPEAFNHFVTSGWEFGANVMAAAKSKTEGGAYSGAVSVSPGVHLYQMTEQGLIVGVSITGAKYYKDDELN